MEFYLPEEYLIVCTAIALRTKEVKVEDIKIFMNKCTVPIEYEEDGVEFKACTFNKNSSSFSVDFNKIKVDMPITKFAHHIWNL